jgi:hypothetical protein
MKTLNIAISEKEFNQLGLNSTELSFSEFVDIVTREMAKRRLNESAKLAEKHNLSTMRFDEIANEIDAERRNDQNRD